MCRQVSPSSAVRLVGWIHDEASTDEAHMDEASTDEVSAEGSWLLLQSLVLDMFKQGS